MTLTGVTILAAACEESEIFVPGGVGAVFRVAWPSATATVEDSETFAVAIYPPAQGGTEHITFTASVDNGPNIDGRRNNGDSIIAFPLSGLTNGPHSIVVRASTGQVANRDFDVNLVPRPSISDVDPDSARLSAQTQITITGQNFIADVQRMRVYLNGVQLRIAQTPTTSSVIANVQQSFGTLRSGLLSVEADRRISRELVPFRIPDGSAPPAGQAQVLLADPSMVPRNAPVVLYGRDFAGGDIAFFGSLHSTPIIFLGADNLGSYFPVNAVTFGLTIVPGLAPGGEYNLTVLTDAGTSTPFPFRIE